MGTQARGNVTTARIVAWDARSAMGSNNSDQYLLHHAAIVQGWQLQDAPCEPGSERELYSNSSSSSRLIGMFV
jgi:hypothetical protein